jgi:hypothetical protein
MQIAKWLAAMALAVLSAYAQGVSSHSLLPTSGQGTLARFSVTTTADVVGLYVLVGDAIAPAQSCMFGVELPSFTRLLVPDSGSGFTTASVEGALRNSRCRLLLDETRGPFVAGARTSMELAVAFSPSFSGTKQVWILAATAAGDTGWLHRGTWTVPSIARPDLLGLDPTTALAEFGDFQARIHHIGGAAQHYLTYILFLPTASRIQFEASKSCLIEYNRVSNRVRLVNATGTDWLPADGAPVGAGGTLLDNSWCTVDTTRIVVQTQAEILRIIGNVRFASDPFGPRLYASFLQAQDVNGRWTGMDQFGSWNIPNRIGTELGLGIRALAVPTSGGTITVDVAQTAPGLAGTSIDMIHVLLAASPAREAKCQIVYFPQSNTINLIDDTRTRLVADVSPMLGSGPPISNSFCTVDPAKSSGFVASNFASLSAWVSSNGALGSVGIFGIAFDTRGYTTHWVQGGSYF